MTSNAKHYFVGQDELEKLLARGEGWLAAHPKREAITRRYLKHRPRRWFMLPLGALAWFAAVAHGAEDLPWSPPMRRTRVEFALARWCLASSKVSVEATTMQC